MVKLFYGIDDVRSDLSFPEFMTWIRRLYKSLGESGYILEIHVLIGGKNYE